MIALILLVLSSSLQVGYGTKVKCFACSSADLTETNSKPDDVAYVAKTCTDTNCTTRALVKTFTVQEFYQKDHCGTFMSDTAQAKLKDNVVECDIGCVKIISTYVDRGETLTGRVTRQCAYNDGLSQAQDGVSRYFSQAEFKRTGAGSDKVNNWFHYCNKDNCNGSQMVSGLISLVIGALLCQLGMLF